MRERGDGLGLAFESRPAVVVVGDGWRQDLDGHIAFEPRVVRAEHLAHATFAELAENAVWAEVAEHRD